MLAVKTIYDVIIVGGGPAGLNAALMLGRACKRVIVIDGGHPRNAAARQLHGFLTRDGTSPRELLRLGRGELSTYLVEVLDDVVVEGQPITKSGNYSYPTGFEIQTKGGRRLMGRKLLFATGTCDDVPNIPGLKECYGSTVHHCPYCDGWEHRGKHLLAYGSEPEKAIGLGLTLLGWSGHVTVLTNGKPLKASERNRLIDNGISVHEEALNCFLHDDARLHGLQLEGGRIVRAEALFFNTGQRSHCDLPLALGCEPTEERLGHTSKRQRTNVPGLFLAGDADGDVQFAIVAAGEGATAAVTINRELQDEDRT